MEKLKNIFKNLGNYSAYNSVGRSWPIFLHEPKVPQALKNITDDKLIDADNNA